MKKLLIIFLMMTLVLSACSTAIQTPVVNHKTPLYESAREYQERTNVENAAIDIVSSQYGYDPEKILILKSSTKTWSDSCLEAVQPNEACVQEIIPGYLILLYVDQTIFEVHADVSAQNIYALNYLTSSVSPGDVAVLLLAKQLEIPSSNILFQSIEKVDWTDSCLDVINEESVCVPITTPGYRIRLEAQGTIYEFHTDTFGSRMIRVY